MMLLCVYPLIMDLYEVRARVVFTSRYKATLGLLVTDLISLNLSQVTETATKLAPFSPNNHTTSNLRHRVSTELPSISLHYSKGVTLKG
ncbi:hypothetical protein TNCV_1845661 [Trichonephila clavipes]|nr:hypothetical protein TNCV_1845661 [Trichonephila clavipes]